MGYYVQLWKWSIKPWLKKILKPFCYLFAGSQQFYVYYSRFYLSLKWNGPYLRFWPFKPICIKALLSIPKSVTKHLLNSYWCDTRAVEWLRNTVKLYTTLSIIRIIMIIICSCSRNSVSSCRKHIPNEKTDCRHITFMFLWKAIRKKSN